MDHEHQDWQTVTVRGNKRTGPKQTVVRKGEAGTEAQRLYKLAETDAAPKKKRITAITKQALISARLDMKKSQRDVDKELAFPPNTIRDIENSAVVPTGPQISALHRYFAASKLTLKVETF